MRRLAVLLSLSVIILAFAFTGIRNEVNPTASSDPKLRAERFARAIKAADRNMRAWMADADPATGLLPDNPDASPRMYNPHNSGADLYSYFVITAQLTAPDWYTGRMLNMLQKEQAIASSGNIPRPYNLDTGQVSATSLFGAGEYAKDGLISITEYLGETAWHTRMVDMVTAAMNAAATSSDFGNLPGSDTEINGDYLQVLPRLYLMTGDAQFLTWGRRIADAYIEEVLPNNNGLPSGTWNFTSHSGNGRLRIRDHGNETIVGLVMQFAVEKILDSERATSYQPVIKTMLDQLLLTANEDGLFVNEIDTATLEPVDAQIADNWGYVYGAIYLYYQLTGDTTYRDAVRNVLANIQNYEGHVWETIVLPTYNLADSEYGSADGYADAIEGAIYLINREYDASAADWIESEMAKMLGMQHSNGYVEKWHGDGNFNRTVLIYALMQSQGVRPAHCIPGMGVGAVQADGGLDLHLRSPVATLVQFDYTRHSTNLSWPSNYWRLNEFPEWYTVNPATTYLLSQGETVLTKTGAELIAGVELSPGDWTLRPVP